MLVDSHCHLDFPDFAEELDQVIARAHDAGVRHMLTIGTHLSRFERVRAVAERFDSVTCTVGVHPHHAESEAPFTTVERLVELSALPRVVGIGESGLDYHYDKSPRNIQQESFRKHIRACLETRLPLVVHSREAEEDTIRIMREEASGAGLTGVMHCFSSKRQLAEDALEFGFEISFSGIITFKNSQDLRDTARIVPLDRLLVETDAPYLAPIPYRGKRNEPAYVVHTAEIVAATKEISLAELSVRTTANFFRLFERAPAPTVLAA